MPDTTHYARFYTNRGWPVFRIRPNSKVPFDRWVNGPTGERASTDAVAAQRWAARRCSFNIGIATGYLCSDGGYLTVLDLDHDASGYVGAPEWATAETYAVSTPGGGMHLYYVTDEPVKSSAGVLGPGIDVRGVGGMVVAPPSRINGKGYCQLGRDATLARLSSDQFCPSHVLSSDAQLSASKQRQSFEPAERVGEGGRDNYLARYAGWWLNRADADYAASVVEGKPAAAPSEYDLAVELDYHNLMVCDPPLPERDIKRIARSIYAKYLRSDEPAL